MVLTKESSGKREEKEATAAWREQKELRLKGGARPGGAGGQQDEDSSSGPQLEQETEVVSTQWSRILQSWQVQADRTLPTWLAKVTWLLS